MQACSTWIEEEIELEPQPREELPGWRNAIAPRDLIPIVKRDPEGRQLVRKLPLSRSECADIPRPCPFVSCRYNLYTDVTPRGYLVTRDCDPLDMPPELSCALDIAEDGEHTQAEVGAILGGKRDDIMGERGVRRIEHDALATMRRDRLLAELVSEHDA